MISEFLETKLIEAVYYFQGLSPQGYLKLACSSILGGLGLYFGKKFFNGGVVRGELLANKSSLKGKTIIVTGASPYGIGYETSKVLHSLGATVILGVRSEKNGNESKKMITEENGGGADRLIVMLMDLTDLASIKKFTEEFKSKFTTLDILINNAGIMMCPHATTRQNVEIQFGTNHLGHFLLTYLLLDMIKQSNGRVVNLSSLAASGIKKESDLEGFCSFKPDVVIGDGSKLANPYELYYRSKFSNLLFTKRLARELANGSEATSYACHPGIVRSLLGRSFTLGGIIFPAMWYFTKSALQGAQTTLHTALEDKSKLKSGSYYADCATKLGNKFEDNVSLQDTLWQTSLDLCKDYLN
ncbi:predicted protein [Naegleria gruberi]|uniref:Predicted protein n=1 Tax=Naegleria gruberi TaxID=5762 RepID=D2V052_NAEGR|nr:uncharacterized protein NAEGRDRAFT_30072 [Naegleria gruberi]EFC49655.1 predicted protein [Naegleria gruberi]|eukprot:XP_002682399.1 predicted protein [Naegleria gruberi strain NEG-M]